MFLMIEISTNSILILLFCLIMASLAYYFYRRMKVAERLLHDLEEEGQKQLDAALPLKENFQFLLDHMSNLIFTANTEGIFTYMNRASVDLFGFEPEELVGKHFTGLVIPEDRERVDQFYKNQFFNRNELTVLEFRVLDKAGNPHWVQQTVKIHIADKSSGNISSFQGAVRDISKEKALEDLVSKSKN